MFISSYRVIKFAAQNFWRNIGLSLATVIILTLTFVSVSFLFVFSIIARQSMRLVQDKIDVSVYFKPEISDKEVRDCEMKLLSLQGTQNTKFISREEALEVFKARHADNDKMMGILKELEINPLGAALVITAKKMEDYNSILEFLKGSDFTNKIQNTRADFENNKNAIEKISLISEKIKKIGIVVSIIFILITILIVFNTIKIAIYTHKDEIMIMKLVGAGNLFIKAPFLIESIIYAVLASIFCVAIIYPLLQLISPSLSELNLIFYFKNNFTMIMGWQLLGAVLINLISSSAAISKYL